MPEPAEWKPCTLAACGEHRRTASVLRPRLDAGTLENFGPITGIRSASTCGLRTTRVTVGLRRPGIECMGCSLFPDAGRDGVVEQPYHALCVWRNALGQRNIVLSQSDEFNVPDPTDNEHGICAGCAG